eukprot:SAG31_NODE_168_length_21484_cov_21.524994_15_plen_1801_part_00
MRAENLYVRIDGGVLQTVVLAVDISTLDEAVAAMEVELANCGATIDVVVDHTGTDVLQITSTTTGTGSSVEIDPASGSNALGLFGGVGTSSLGSGSGALHETLVVSVNGGSEQVIPLTTNIGTPFDAATALSAIVGAAVSVHNDIVKITSATTGPASTVSVGLSGSYTGDSFAAYNFAMIAGTFTGDSIAPHDFSTPASPGTLAGNGFVGADFSGAGLGTQPLVLTVDGSGAPITVSLTAAMSSAGDVVAALNADGAFAAAAVASVDGSEVKITSRTTGPLSSVAIETGSSGANAQALFGSSPVVETGASAAAEDLAVTIDDVPITVSLDVNVMSAADAVAALNADATFAAAATASVEGGNIKITSASTGPSSTVAVDGTGSGPNALLLFGSGISSNGADRNEQLTIRVDGGSPQTITISSNIRSASDFVAATAPTAGSLAGELIPYDFSRQGTGGFFIGDAFVPYDFARPATAGFALGSAFAPYDFGSLGAEQLVLTVDSSVSPVPVAFSAAVFSPDQVVSTLNEDAAFAAVAVASVDGSEVKITSRTTGPLSSVAIETGSSGANAQALFGSSPVVATGASAAAEDLAVTIDDVPITVSLDVNVMSAADAVAALNADATFAAAATASVEGGNIKITSASTGPSSTVAVDGTGSGPNALLLFGSGISAQGVSSAAEQLTIRVDGGSPQTITISSNITSAADMAALLTVSCTPDRWIGGRWAAASCSDGLVGATTEAVRSGRWGSSDLRITSDSPGASSSIAVSPSASGPNALRLLNDPVAEAGTPGIVGAAAAVALDGTNIVLQSNTLYSATSTVAVDGSSGPNILRMFGTGRTGTASGPHAAALFGGQLGRVVVGEAPARVQLDPTSAVVKNNAMLIRVGQVVSGIGLTSTSTGPVTVVTAPLLISAAAPAAVEPIVHWLDSTLDACGSCLRNSSTARGLGCLDCRGLHISGFAVAAQYDHCGICGRPDEPQFNSSCSDCLGLPNGDSTLDECGVCRPSNRQSGASNAEAQVGIKSAGAGSSTLEMVSHNTLFQSSPITQHFWGWASGADPPSILQPTTLSYPTLRLGDGRTSLFALGNRNVGSDRFDAGPTPLQTGQTELAANSATMTATGNIVVGDANKSVGTQLSILSNSSKFKTRTGSRLATSKAAMGKIPFFQMPPHNDSETGAGLVLKCGSLVDCAMTIQGGSNMSASLTWSGANGTNFPFSGNNDTGGRFRLLQSGSMNTLELTGMSSNSNLQPLICRDQQCYDTYGTERTGLFLRLETIENTHNFSITADSACQRFSNAATARVATSISGSTTVALDGASGHPKIVAGQVVTAPVGVMTPGGLVTVSSISAGVCTGSDDGTGSGGTLTGVNITPYDFSGTAAEQLLITVDGNPVPQSVIFNTNVNDASDVVNMINAAPLDGVQATVEGANVKLVSTRSTGLTSTVELEPSSGPNALALFGSTASPPVMMPGTPGVACIADGAGTACLVAGGNCVFGVTTVELDTAQTVSDQTVLAFDRVCDEYNDTGVISEGKLSWYGAFTVHGGNLTVYSAFQGNQSEATFEVDASTSDNNAIAIVSGDDRQDAVVELQAGSSICGHTGILHIVILHIVILHIVILHIVILHIVILHIVILHIVMLHIVILHIVILHIVITGRADAACGSSGGKIEYPFPYYDTAAYLRTHNLSDCAVDARFCSGRDSVTAIRNFTFYREVCLDDTCATNASLCSGCGVATASSEATSFTAARNAFDGNSSTFWDGCCLGYPNQQLSYDLGEPRPVSLYSLASLVFATAHQWMNFFVLLHILQKIIRNCP